MKPYWQRNLPDGRWHRYPEGEDTSSCTRAKRFDYSPEGIEGKHEYPLSGDICADCAFVDMGGELQPTLNTPEPAPIANDQPATWNQVIADMAERNVEGTRKYGTPLQAFNGRKPLVDAYQEVLDLTVYMRQEIEERKFIVRDFLIQAVSKGLISHDQHVQLSLMETNK